MRLSRLDGIRGIAILMVLARHAFTLPLGWAGVDFFFVLSGFLITGILRRDRENPAFWGPFYIKRATRILPPLVVCLLGAAIFFPIPWRHLGIYYALFAANISEVIYPHQGHSLGALWSLAVEEDFYLLWPFAIRFLDRKHLVQLLVVVLCLEPIARAIATPYLHTFWPIYYLTPFRLDGLAAGSLLAILVEREAPRLYLKNWGMKLTLASMALFAILSATHHFKRDDNQLPFNTFGYSLIAVICFFLIAHVYLNAESWSSKILSNRPLVWLGVISYGVYLFHPLILEVVERNAPPHLVKLWALAALPFCVLFAWVSFKFYEKPIIRFGHVMAAQRAQKEPHAIEESYNRVA